MSESRREAGEFAVLHYSGGTSVLVDDFDCKVGDIYSDGKFMRNGTPILKQKSDFIRCTELEQIIKRKNGEIEFLRKKLKEQS